MLPVINNQKDWDQFLHLLLENSRWNFQLDNAQEFYERSKDVFNSLFTEKITQFNDLDNKLAIFNAMLIAAEIKNRNNDFDNKINGEEIKINREEPEEHSKGDLKRSCKRLFKKIAKLTHPDAINSNKLKDAFIAAKRAYKTQNFSELIRIYNSLQEGKCPSSFESKMDLIKEKIIILQADISSKRSYYDQLVNTVPYKFGEHYFNKDDLEKSKTVLRFDKLIYQEIQQKRLMLQHLKQRLRELKYPFDQRL